MSVVKTHRVTYPLAQKVRRGPRIGVAMAITRAEAAVAGMRDRLLSQVDEQIAAAELALQEHSSNGSDAALAQLADCGEQLIGISGACGLPALADAALGLCDLLDWMQQSSRFQAQALAVHVAALRLLRAKEDAGAARHVLDGLARVRARVVDGPDHVAS